ncbi:MAG: DUF3419 family protein [Bacteroidales bacterium]|nr:DUF3419 family protein [Bacteroidales bacterium]
MSEQLKYPIRYSQCWEDTELMLEALDVRNNDIVVSIASGGCNSLAILSEYPSLLYIVDRNPCQIYLTELKYLAIKHLDNSIGEFLGYQNTKIREDLYHKISNKLSDDSRKFWDKHLNLIQIGVVHSGKFEKYLNLFRKLILPLVQGKKNVKKLLMLTEQEEKEAFYKRKWNNLRWRLLFKVFFGKQLMQKYGRSREMFRLNTKNQTGNIYFNRTERALKYGNLATNRYLEYILTGNQKKNAPYFLLPGIQNKIRQANEPAYQNESLLDFLINQKPNSIDKFNLSDVFEVHSEKDTLKIFKEILRTGRKGGRLIFWNNLVLRDIPEELISNFRRESELEEKLIKKDKVFFYDNFKIYSIN